MQNGDHVNVACRIAVTLKHPFNFHLQNLTKNNGISNIFDFFNLENRK